MTSQLVISELFLYFFPPPTQNLKKSHKSTNKKPGLILRIITIEQNIAFKIV